MYKSPNEVPKISGIYALCCPASGKVKYIGQAKNIRRRIQSHVNMCGSSHLPCSRWVNSLRKNAEVPAVKILEKSENLDEREAYWISHYGLDNLLNLREGGSDCRFSTFSGAKMPWGRMQSPAQYMLIQIRRTAGDLGSEGLREKANEIASLHEEKRREGLKSWVWYNLNLVWRIDFLRERYSGKMIRSDAEEILFNG